MHSTGIQLRIVDLLYAFLKRWKIIVSLAIVGLIFGLMLSGMSYMQGLGNTYEISGSMIITTLADNLYLGGEDGPDYYDFHLPADMYDTVRYIMRSDRVINEVIKRQQLLGYSSSDLLSNVSVEQHKSTAIVVMDIEWYDVDEAISIWNNIVDVTNEVIPQTLQLGSLEVINYPSVAVSSTNGFSKTLPVFLAVLGFGAGLGFAIIELLMRPTLTNVKDVETVFGLETLGIIPRDNTAFKKSSDSILVQDDKARSSIKQYYSTIAYILRTRLGSKESHHCFYVTSAIAQEGKTTVAAQLAIQLSDMEHHTLLIDFDTRNPSLGSLFLGNMDYSRSLNALYRGEANESEAITTLTGYLDILPMVLEHDAISMDGMVVELIQRLKEKYEYVIIDAPPVGQVSETLSLNQVANTVLFVIGYDMSSIPEIQSSLDKLHKTDVRILGCIVNAAHTSHSKGIDKGEFKKTAKKRMKMESETPVSSISNEQDAEMDSLMKKRGKQEEKSRPKVLPLSRTILI